MINSLFRKILALYIILLFIGTSVLPGMSKEIKSLEQTSGLIPSSDVLDVNYIYNITKALSDIVFTEYDDNEIARGRDFGSVGEHKAANILLENMSNLGLWTWKESIVNTPILPDVASVYWVNEYNIVLKNISSGVSKKIDGYISPAWKGPRGSPNIVDYNFSFQDLKFKLAPRNLQPFGRFLRDGFCKDDYVYIMEDTSYNPNITYPIREILTRFLGPYSDFSIFYGYAKLMASLAIWYKFYPHCQGLVRYDFNDDTYNMVNAENWNLPVVFINGTIGKEILSNIDNYRLDFYINQNYKESVESYNVIGQLNGTDPSKTVLVDCLYDGWWTQATGDSAIGMAMVLGIAKWFKDNNITPKYTVKFVGFGGEERGLRGAKYYSDIHKDENIIYVIDLNQLGFFQGYPELNLDIMSNNAGFLKDIFKIAEQSDYANRTGYAGLRKFYMPRGAPSDDRAFTGRIGCKTVCFLKGINWALHHRDGLGHTEGDVLKYFDTTDVTVTGEIILNITKYLIVNQLN